MRWVALGHPFSWMNVGMLAFGLPAQALARRAAFAGASHGLHAPLPCAVAMIAKMTAGSRLVSRLVALLTPVAAVAADYTLMLAGMSAGMLLVQIPRKAAIATSAQPAIVTRKPAAPA